MTNSEFKAWFESFTEGFFGEEPTSKQWKRIVARVREIDGNAVTQRVFVDRYWGPYDSLAAMQALGRADAAN